MLALSGLLGLVSIRTMLLALIPFAALVALSGHGSPRKKKTVPFKTH
jgi:hypothetical protein